MFVDEADIEERMVSFDCIMKIIARSKEMCTSPPMLEFLGFDLLADRKYHKVDMHEEAGLVQLVSQTKDIRMCCMRDENLLCEFVWNFPGVKLVAKKLTLIGGELEC